MKLRHIFALFGALALGACGLAVAQYSTANYHEAGTGRWVVGGAADLGLDVVSGGVLNVKSGAQLQFAGTDKTSALAAAVTAPVNGVAAGYKIARGETALDGSNPTDVATGLTTIIACTLTVKKTTAPTSEETVTYTTSSGTLSMYVWQAASNTLTTLVASASTATVGWICIGT